MRINEERSVHTHLGMYLHRLAQSHNAAANRRLALPWIDPAACVQLAGIPKQRCIRDSRKHGTCPRQA